MTVVIAGQSWTDRNSVFRNWRSRWKLIIRRCWRWGHYLQSCFSLERCCTLQVLHLCMGCVMSNVISFLSLVWEAGFRAAGEKHAFTEASYSGRATCNKCFTTGIWTILNIYTLPVYRMQQCLHTFSMASSESIFPLGISKRSFKPWTKPNKPSATRWIATLQTLDLKQNIKKLDKKTRLYLTALGERTTIPWSIKSKH